MYALQAGFCRGRVVAVGFDAVIGRYSPGWPAFILFSAPNRCSFLEALQNEPYNAPPFTAGQNFRSYFQLVLNATRCRLLGPRSGIFVA
jgi:hypothetical protein